MIRPKNSKGEPILLICVDEHFVVFNSNKGISVSMHKKLRDIERKNIRNGAAQNENGIIVTTFILNELSQYLSKKIKNNTKKIKKSKI